MKQCGSAEPPSREDNSGAKRKHLGGKAPACFCAVGGVIDPAARRAKRDKRSAEPPGSRRIRPGAERNLGSPKGAGQILCSRRGLSAVAEGAKRDRRSAEPPSKARAACGHTYGSVWRMPRAERMAAYWSAGLGPSTLEGLTWGREAGRPVASKDATKFLASVLAPRE